MKHFQADDSCSCKCSDFSLSILLLCIYPSSLSHTSVYSAPFRDLFIALLLLIQPDNTFIFLLFPYTPFFVLHCAYSQGHATFSLFNECQNSARPLGTIHTTTACDLKRHRNVKYVKKRQENERFIFCAASCIVNITRVIRAIMLDAPGM